MKKAILGFFLLLICTASQLWAAGAQEAIEEGAGWKNRIHPGAKIILEASGYKFDSNSNPISYSNRPIVMLFSQTISNPHSFDKNTIYIADLTVNQWVDSGLLATTGSQLVNQILPIFSSPELSTILEIGGGSPVRGTQIFIHNIPDRFKSDISKMVQNASLIYTGVQNFRMADGSAKVFPVFQLTGFFNNTVLQALQVFNSAFEAGIYKEENGYQYSRIGDRTFGRDIATKRELHEWDGNQWIVLARE